jgi:DNA-binding response OmpR family regulator
MHVWVVDDSPVARVALRGMLENEGFTVSEADDGDQVIGDPSHVDADLVLCDMLMPRCNGLQVIRELRREMPHVKIIAMSGGGSNGNADMLQTARYLGADEILYKPFGRTTLMAAVRQVMLRLSVS